MQIRRTHPIIAACLLALCVAAGPALIEPSPAPKSDSGIEAVAKYNVAQKRAYDAWHSAQIRAEKQFSVDLGEAVNTATHEGQLDEGILLQKLKLDSAERLTLLTRRQSPIVAVDATVWNEDGSPIEFHADGTMVKTAEPEHQGNWRQEGRTVIMVWNFGDYIDRLEISDDGTSMDGQNNRDEKRHLWLPSAGDQRKPDAIDPVMSPKSPLGMAAVYRYTLALQTAFNLQKEAGQKAEETLDADLNASLKLATRAGNLDEAVILDALRKGTKDRLNRRNSRLHLVCGDGTPAVWKYDTTGITFQLLPDGTAVQPGVQVGDKAHPAAHRGIWTHESRLLIVTWPDSKVIERYVLSKYPVTTLQGKNNRGEDVAFSSMDAAAPPNADAMVQTVAGGQVAQPASEPTTQPATDQVDVTATATPDAATSQPVLPKPSDPTTSWFDDPDSQPATRP